MRLFTGLSIAPPVVEALSGALAKLRPKAALRWSPPENLHITLKFIGEWPEPRLPELQNVLASAPKPPDFTVTVSGFGFLPDARRPHNFVAEVQAGPELAALASSIEDALVTIGCPREKRPYTPHLTLARIKDENIRPLREALAAMPRSPFGSFEATQFHLYRSRTGGAGSEYAILASYPLAAGASA